MEPNANKEEFGSVESKPLFPGDRIAEFCRTNGITRLAIFGSALREILSLVAILTFSLDSMKRYTLTLFDMIRMEAELKAILGREVDLVSQRDALNRVSGRQNLRAEGL